MKLPFFSILLGAILLIGCKSEVSLVFEPDADGVWKVPARQLDAWARAIVKADDSRAKALLDEGYAQADSLSAGDGQARTLDAFSLEVADRFLDLKSPLYNEHAYELALDREEQCENWTSWGRRSMDWRRSILNLNRAGTRVCDFWLSKGPDTPDTLLRKLLPAAPLTVLFLYGEECPSCETLLGEIRSSRAFKRLSRAGEVQFVSLYTGENPAEFRELSSRLPSYWDNWYDRENVVKYDRAFDTRLIPSLYVVGSDEIVRLRGAQSVRETEKYLRSQ